VRRITHPTAVATIPSFPDPAGSVTGHFAGKQTTPAAQSPTVVTPEWAEAVQEEIMNVITWGGLTPSKTDLTQMRQAIQAGVSGAVPNEPASQLRTFASSSGTPTGYLLADGAAVSRTTYSALFTAIGTTWGAGNGSTTFNLPDYRGKTIVGAGQGTGLTNRTTGQAFGAETHTLSQSEMPSHSHNFYGPQTGQSFESGPNNVWFVGGYPSGSHNNATSVLGSDAPHNNMQPSAVSRIFIKT
jgi:microcystin-dependent protein